MDHLYIQFQNTHKKFHLPAFILNRLINYLFILIRLFLFLNLIIEYVFSSCFLDFLRSLHIYTLNIRIHHSINLINRVDVASQIVLSFFLFKLRIILSVSFYHSLRHMHWLYILIHSIILLLISITHMQIQTYFMQL